MVITFVRLVSRRVKRYSSSTALLRLESRSPTWPMDCGPPFGDWERTLTTWAGLILVSLTLWRLVTAKRFRKTQYWPIDEWWEGSTGNSVDTRMSLDGLTARLIFILTFIRTKSTGNPIPSMFGWIVNGLCRPTLLDVGFLEHVPNSISRIICCSIWPWAAALRTFQAIHGVPSASRPSFRPSWRSITYVSIKMALRLCLDRGPVSNQYRQRQCPCRPTVLRQNKHPPLHQRIHRLQAYHHQ